MTFTQNESSTDEIEKPTIVRYRPYMEVLFFTFKKSSLKEYIVI